MRQRRRYTTGDGVNVATKAHVEATYLRTLGHLEDILSARPYLLGDEMSAADLSICYVMRGYRRMVSETMPANTQAYFDRVTALPSYERTVKADAETAERLQG